MENTSARNIVEEIIAKTLQWSDHVYQRYAINRNLDLCLYALFCARYNFPFSSKSLPLFEHLPKKEPVAKLYFQLQSHIVQSSVYNSFANIQQIEFDFNSFVREIRLHYTTEAYQAAYYSIIKKTILSFSKFSRYMALSLPEELSIVTSYVLNNSNIHSVYNPFSDTSILSNGLNDNISYLGQEIDTQRILYASVLLDAKANGNSKVECCDSIINWDRHQYDAVIARLPFNIRLAERYHLVFRDVKDLTCRTLEEFFFTQAYNVNKAKISIAIMPMGFCYSQRFAFLREYLVENNLLDSIIALPSNAIEGSTIATVMVICKAERGENAHIHFIDASSMYQKQEASRTYTVDSEKIIRCLSDQSNEDHAIATKENVREQQYILHFNLYKVNRYELRENQKKVILHELIKPVSASATRNTAGVVFYSPQCFHDDFIQVLLHKDNADHTANARLNTRVYDTGRIGECYLLTNGAYTNRYMLHTKNIPFAVPVGTNVYVIDQTKVVPEYLVYLLLNMPEFEHNRIPFTYCLNLSIAIEGNMDAQRQIVEKEKQAYYARLKTEQEADVARLGIKRNISDLEHLLGSTQLRIDKIISELETKSFDVESYRKAVKYLKDNVEYMKRIIKFDGAKIYPESFDKCEEGLDAFLNDYIESWKNYGGPYFELFKNGGFVDVKSKAFDKTMLTVMMDSILNNAIRHGFHKNSKYVGEGKNEVMINCSPVVYNDVPYALISVANNGDPISSNFTVKDYISRGRFDSSTGRSGLGGYHVYEIVKGHNGFLNIRSDSKWNVIIDILLPLKEMPTINTYDYEYECV